MTALTPYVFLPGTAREARDQVVDDLQARPWGATDGQVIDPHGLHWLIGFEHDHTD